MTCTTAGGLESGDVDCDGVPDAGDVCAGYSDAADYDSDGTPDGCDEEEELRFIPSLNSVVSHSCCDHLGLTCPMPPDYTWGGHEWWVVPGLTKADVLTCTASDSK